MHAVRCQKAILDALAQAVGVDRVAEVIVAVAGFLAQWSSRHTELHSRLEVVEHGTPGTLVTAGAPVAFVDDDEIEEVRAVLTEDVFTGGGQGLVDAEVHVTALAHVAACDLVPGIAEWREHLGHRIIDKDVAVGQEQYFWTAIFAGAVPAAVPQLPANLKSHAGLAGAGRQRSQNALLPEQDRFDHTIDRDVLVITRHLAGD